MKDIVIISAARDAIGDFGGALKDLSLTEIGILTARAAIDREGLLAEEVKVTFFGNVIHTEPREMHMSRTTALGAGLSENALALTFIRLCGSVLQAMALAIRTIALSSAEIALAGGAESKNRGEHLMPAARWVQKMGKSGPST